METGGQVEKQRVGQLVDGSEIGFRRRRGKTEILRRQLSEQKRRV